jgi:hypothetical protein
VAKSENNHYPLLDALRARGGFAGGGYGRPALVCDAERNLYRFQCGGYFAFSRFHAN